MATNTIKGLTVEIGGDTTKLGKALESVNKKTSDLSGELGQINKLLKLDPGNTELLAQKQKVLADAVSNTREKLDKLKDAEKQVQAQFERGEVSEAQVRALQREIIETTRKLDSYEKAAAETADALEKLGKESDDAAEEIEDVGKKADDAEESADKLGDTLDRSTSAGFDIVAAAATAAVGAIVGCIEASEDYRREMGKLDTAFESNGFSSETATTAYKDLQKIIGETDQTVEAVNHLAALVDTEEELAHWTGDILPGVYAKFGASLKPEALTEAANETAKTGSVTGALADALNWAAAAGETFGVELKKNVKFTKLSDEELAKLSKSKRADYEATKEQYDAIEEYNKKVEEATSAEDYFNIALENCTDEQERQQLITKTLTGLYKKSASQYKKTNKAIIESNEATEEWNATMAELGAEMAPVMTDIKKFGVSMLENAKEPMKDIASFISSKALPALTDFGKWFSNNTPLIKAGLVAVTTAFVAYKAAVVAADVAQKGLKGAIMATEAAQKLLNVAQAATPWGLVATAVAAVTAGLLLYHGATEDARKAVDVLTEEEKQLAASADEAAASFREQQKATNETLGGISSQMEHTQSLAKELTNLADASGKVKEKDQERVNFILNELNNALGTEYTMVDGVIQKYDDLKTSIDEVIQSKLANALLETAQADYITAQQNKADALKNLMLKEEEYEAQQAAYNEFYTKYLEDKAAAEEKLRLARVSGNTSMERSARNTLTMLEHYKDNELGLLEDKKKQYEGAAKEYGNYSKTIMDYEEAQAAALSGNYDRAVELLTRKGQSFGNYSDIVDAETAEVLDTLFQEAIDMGLAAERTKKNFESGVEGYTQEMVDEAEKGYQDAMEAYADAYADAVGVGDDLGTGLQNGLENKRSALISKAKSLVSGIISAMKKEADSNSPSKKTTAFGEDMGEGAEIGIEHKTKDVARAAQNQVAAVLDAYQEQERTGQETLRGLAERQTTQQITNQMVAAGANTDVLNKILAAIKQGQVITIDGKTLVGATAGDMDATLGQRRVLATRGAV